MYLLANQTHPKCFAKLTSLNKLILSGNLITDCLTPQSLGLSKDLKLLDLSKNKITGLFEMRMVTCKRGGKVIHQIISLGF